MVDRIGVEGDAGEERDGRDQPGQQAEHQQEVVPEPLGGDDERG